MIPNRKAFKVLHFRLKALLYVVESNHNQTGSIADSQNSVNSSMMSNTLIIRVMQN